MSGWEPFCDSLGMTLVERTDGRAVATLTVTPDHRNGHGNAHGGVLFTLADTALGAASNTATRAAVASTVSIHFLRPVAVGDELRAEAVREHRGRRVGLYRIRVTRGDELVAVADGQTFAVPRERLR